MISTIGSVVALLLNLLLVAANSTINSSDNARQPWNNNNNGNNHHYRRQSPLPHMMTAASSSSSSSPSTTTDNNANCQGITTSLHSHLDNLDVSVGTRLDSIEHKLEQLDHHILSNRDNLNEKTHDLKRHMMNIESLQQGNRATRQATGDLVGAELSSSEKLDAVATLLASSAANIKYLEHELSANVTRLLLDTNALLVRVERLRRAQQKCNHGNVITYAGTPSFGVSNEDNVVMSCNNMDHVSTNGILRMQLTNTPAFYVLCDEVYDRGGWLVIQNRHYGDISFQRGWSDYKLGFGNLAGDFFIGLDKLHALTTHTLHELAIILVDHNNVTHKARYNLFAIGNEQEAYDLRLLGKYSGDAGDALSYHAGSKFSTYDNDNDGCVECNCAAAHLGGWWYNWCDMSNLNGKYYTKDVDKTPTYTGVYWQHFNGPNYSMRSVRMMIRPLPNPDEVRR